MWCNACNAYKQLQWNEGGTMSHADTPLAQAAPCIKHVWGLLRLR